MRWRKVRDLNPRAPRGLPGSSWVPSAGLGQPSVLVLLTGVEPAFLPVRSGMLIQLSYSSVVVPREGVEPPVCA